MYTKRQGCRLPNVPIIVIPNLSPEAPLGVASLPVGRQEDPTRAEEHGMIKLDNFRFSHVV